MLRIWQSSHRMLVRHDPVLGHRYVPDMNVRIPNEVGACFVRTAAGESPDLDGLTEAVVADWSPREVGDALRPVIRRLLSLGRKHAPVDALEEEVADSVYVMF